MATTRVKTTALVRLIRTVALDRRLLLKSTPMMRSASWRTGSQDSLRASRPLSPKPTAAPPPPKSPPETPFRSPTMPWKRPTKPRGRLTKPTNHSLIASFCEPRFSLSWSKVFLRLSLQQCQQEVHALLGLHPLCHRLSLLLGPLLPAAAPE